MAPGFWSKAKGFFGRVGRGIAATARKVYDIAKNVAPTVFNKASGVLNAFGANPDNKFLNTAKDITSKTAKAGDVLFGSQ